MTQDPSHHDRDAVDPGPVGGGESAASAALIRALAAHPEDIARLVDELHRRVTDEDSLLDLMHRTSREAVRMITDVHWAGVTAQFAGAPFTAANTDSRVLVVDEGQYGQGDGPCLQSMRTDQVVVMTEEQVADSWPLLAAATRAAGVHAFHAEPLHARGQAAGSLNLYSATPGGLQDPDPDVLTVLTEYLDRGLTDYSAAQPGEPDAHRLQTSLRRRHVVNQAVGALMAAHGVSAAEGMRSLQDRAGDNSRLEQAARDVIAEYTRQPGEEKSDPV